MSATPKCPKCSSDFTYEDASMVVCPECAHEWSKEAARKADEERSVRDAHANVLQGGDSVMVVKDLKVEGSSSVVKVGTKVRNIRRVEGDRDIDCKIDGIGSMGLKFGFVRKA